MTTKDKIIDLLDLYSERTLEDIFKQLLGYFDGDIFTQSGYEIGERRYTLNGGNEVIGEIVSLHKDGEHIMYYDSYSKEIRLNVDWNNSFLTISDVENEQIRRITKMLADYTDHKNFKRNK